MNGAQKRKIEDIARAAYKGAIKEPDDSKMGPARWMPSFPTAFLAILALALLAVAIWVASPALPSPAQEAEIFQKNASEEENKQAGKDKTKNEKSDIKSGCCVVHLVGAVKNPGIFNLESNSRISEAIEKAGGPATNADLTRINLARIVQDGEQIWVPAKGETQNPTQGQNGGTTGHTSSMPGQNGLLEADGQVNINLASVQELDSLPGVGPATANLILQYRSKNGPFKKIEDLKKISGIGEKSFEKLRGKIRV